MPIIFTDKVNDIFFDYQNDLPSASMSLRIKGESPYRLRCSYCMFGCPID
jgi:hypothetical protein